MTRFVCALVFAFFCGATGCKRVPGGEAEVHRDRLKVESGQRKLLRFAPGSESASANADRTQWTGADLAGTPFAYMERQPLVLKADDFGDPRWAEATERFLHAVDRVGGVATLGIITNSLSTDRAANALYPTWNDRGFELWFHGHTHLLSEQGDEFRLAPLEKQVESFTVGLATARQRLGVELTSFGAPGNGIDANTVLAIAKFPQIRSWLFGPEDSPVYRFPRLSEVEAPVGVVRDPEAIVADLERVAATHSEVITLQMHPLKWRDEDFVRFEQTLAKIVATNRYRFTSPTAFLNWRHEREHLLLTRCAAETYLVDSSAVTATAAFGMQLSNDLVSVEDVAACPR